MKIFTRHDFLSMRHMRNILSAVAGLLLLTFTGVAAADGVSRPFSATLEGNANPVPTADPCILVNTETAASRALHLGEGTWGSEEVVNFCSNPAGADVDGKFVITAANGEQIFGVYRTLAHLDFGTNTITALGRYEITGGTGRFEGAKGEGDISASGSLLPPFEVTGGLFGRISY